jgi:hypothetical protein
MSDFEQRLHGFMVAARAKNVAVAAVPLLTANSRFLHYAVASAPAAVGMTNSYWFNTGPGTSDLRRHTSWPNT